MATRTHVRQLVRWQKNWRWIVVDMDSTVVQRPESGLFPTLNESPCLQPLLTSLKYGIGLCVVTTADSRSFWQVWDCIPSELRRDRRVVMSLSEGGCVVYGDEHGAPQLDQEYENKGIEGGTLMSEEVCHALLVMLRQAVVSIFTAFREDRTLIKSLSTKYQTPFNSFLDRVEKQGQSLDEALTLDVISTPGAIMFETMESLVSVNRPKIPNLKEERKKSLVRMKLGSKEMSKVQVEGEKDAADESEEDSEFEADLQNAQDLVAESTPLSPDAAPQSSMATSDPSDRRVSSSETSPPAVSAASVPLPRPCAIAAASGLKGAGSISVMGMPRRICSEHYRPFAAAFEALGVVTSEAPNSLWIRKKGVDKATPLQWLASHAEYNFSFESAVAFGDSPHSNDMPLSLLPPMPFVSVAADVSVVPAHVHFHVGGLEYGTAIILRRMLETVEKEEMEVEAKREAENDSDSSGACREPAVVAPFPHPNLGMGAVVDAVVTASATSITTTTLPPPRLETLLENIVVASREEASRTTAGKSMKWVNGREV